MTARTRKWVVLSALGLLSLDLALAAVAVPKARGWLESARSSARVRAGCSSSSCPKDSAPLGTASGASATGLPASMLGMTLE